MSALKGSRLKMGAAGTITTLALILVSFVGPWEGLRLQSYPDIIGKWTACYGETKGIRPGMKFTKSQCDAMFVDSLVEHEAGMRKCLKNPDAIPDKSYVAFASLTYNIGVGGFCKSSIARKANAGDLIGACHSIMLYNKARVRGGPLQPVRGLTRRRTAETTFCLEGARAR